MVEKACRAALFHEYARNLSDGYETILGGGGAAGVMLSGGQKQRLAIARARLRSGAQSVFRFYFTFCLLTF